MKSHAFGLALLSAAAIVASAPAQAAGTLTRTFVSSAGVDGNPCTIAQPCATFAAAYNAVEADGIVAALDPGKYGPLTITMPVTVNGNGWAAITAPAAGNGITINTGSGNVILTGLEIDGAGAAYNGIVFNTGSNLTVSNCIVKDFIINNSDANGTNGNGILIGPTSGTINFTIVNTIAVNNGYLGVYYFPLSGNATVTGTIDHVVATNNGYGIGVNSASGSGGSATVSISNSIANDNGVDGILSNSGPGPATVTIDNDEISNNEFGIFVSAGTVLLSRSVIAKNSIFGVENVGTIYTYQDSRVYLNGNGNAINGNALAPVSPQ